MVALVTGAWGFLGSAVAERLEAEGETVVRAGRPETELPSATFDDLLAETEPELIVHCAGPASVPASVRDPGADFRGSVDVVAALGESVRRLPRPPRLLLLSSAAVYGQPDRLPVDEGAPLRAVSPYGTHRILCEQLVESLTRLHAVPTASLRVFSAYGEGLRRQIMWDVCAQAVRGGAVALDGTGTESRDFVHSADVAQAVSVVAGASPFAADVYNVGTEVETTIALLTGMLLQGLDLQVPVEFSGRQRVGDPAHWRADTSRLRALGFAPTTDIETGARRYARWALSALEHG